MLSVKILNLKETVYEGASSKITAPGIEGQFTVLSNHRSLLTKIKKGVIIVGREKEKPLFFEAPKGGVFELRENQATILLA